MSAGRALAGILAGTLLLLSSAAHAFFGWAQLRQALAGASVPEELIQGVGIGWQFGGAAMLGFGVIVVWQFVGHLRGRPTPLLPSRVIAGIYLLFGAGAMALTGFNPFFLVFLIPGLLLAVAAWSDA